MTREQTDEYVVQEKIAEAPGVYTLKLLRKNSTLSSYCAGQYMTVYLPHTDTKEGKAYSISSAPFETTLNLTIKKIGEFSTYLTDLESGDTLTTSLPYGYFYSESTTTPLVLVAAGIGVSPFRGMILETLRTNPERKLALFYSNRTVEDIIFKNILDELQARHPQLTVTHFITRQEDLPQNIEGGGVTKESFVRGRMNADIILEKLKNALSNTGESTKECEFLLCGSIPFVRDLWQGLKAASISDEKIYTEAFFSQ